LCTHRVFPRCNNHQQQLFATWTGDAPPPCLIRLTFELSFPRRQSAIGCQKQDATGAWRGQAKAAIAGQLERGVRRRLWHTDGCTSMPKRFLDSYS
jgi:hypothetical protein